MIPENTTNITIEMTDDKIIEKIINNFFEAAATGNNHVIRSMIKDGISVNCQNQFNTTALHLATYNGQLGTVELLLAHGADKTLKNSNGRTPLDVSESLLFDDISLLLIGEETCIWTS
jgi:ankyrin repeat protein